MLNQKLFEQGKKSYDSGNYADALRSYYVCLKEQKGPFEPGEAGKIYHMLGNCLVKMHSFDDASNAYEKALLDTDYANSTAIHSNFGLSLTKQGRYKEAIEQFETVLKDPTYKTPFKAYNGMGNAYMKLGDYAAAGTAYRNAAVDERNPAPVKALMNLGTCFTRLGRPQDALDTYNAIFEFNPDQKLKSKAYANMGSAHVALGQMDEAVGSFEKALSDPNYKLSASAKADFEKARNSKVDFDDSGIFTMANIGYESAYDNYNSYQQPQQGMSLQPYEDQLANQQALAQGVGAEQTQILPQQSGEVMGAGIPDANDTGFFNVQESESDSFIDINSSIPKKHIGLRILLVIIIILLLCVIAGGILFWRGYGYPTQEQTIQKMFTAHAAGEDVSNYWVSTSNSADTVTINKLMNSVAETDNITIDYVERGMLESSAIATANLDEGGSVRYDISLTRDFSNIFGAIGWKINGIEFAFPSTQNSMSTSTMTTSSDNSDDESSGEGSEDEGSESESSEGESSESDDSSSTDSSSTDSSAESDSSAENE